MVMTDPVQQAIQAITAVLFTNQGERLMLPTFGASIQQLLFDANNDIDFTQIATEAAQQVQTADGTLTNVTVTVVPGQQTGALNLEVSFTVYGSSQVHQVIYNFDGDIIGES